MPPKGHEKMEPSMGCFEFNNQCVEYGTQLVPTRKATTHSNGSSQFNTHTHMYIYIYEPRSKTLSVFSFLFNQMLLAFAFTLWMHEAELPTR